MAWKKDDLILLRFLCQSVIIPPLEELRGCSEQYFGWKDCIMTDRIEKNIKLFANFCES